MTDTKEWAYTAPAAAAACGSKVETFASTDCTGTATDPVDATGKLWGDSVVNGCGVVTKDKVYNKWNCDKENISFQEQFTDAACTAKADPQPTWPKAKTYPNAQKDGVATMCIQFDAAKSAKVTLAGWAEKKAEEKKEGDDAEKKEDASGAGHLTAALAAGALAIAATQF